MKKKKSYPHTFFPARVLQAAEHAIIDLADANVRRHANRVLSAEVNAEHWTYETMDEFLADYRRNPSSASFYLAVGPGLSVNVAWDDDNLFLSGFPSSDVTVGAPTRQQIASVFEIFESAAEEARLPAPAPQPKAGPVVFIGHGGSALWRDLKDHLQDKHGVKVEAYEVGARAGHHIRDILDDMMTKSSFALLVLTAEDETVGGDKRARQNVIHETGLFQGKLGFSRAIVVLEKGVEEFSNINGIQQLRFSQGNIKEIFGDVLATLRREFPNALA